MESQRSDWPTTTHVWAHDVDPEHLEQCRQHAADLAPTGVLHLILEVLAYAEDEAAAQGVRGAASVTVGKQRVRISDDGRGTDTRRDEHGQMIRKPVMATPDVRFQGPDSPLLPDGHHRRGMSLVAALSSELIHENRRRDGAWSQTYRHGIPDGELGELPATADTGTTVEFQPDTWDLDSEALDQLPDLAAEFAHLGVTFRLT